VVCRSRLKSVLKAIRREMLSVCSVSFDRKERWEIGLSLARSSLSGLYFFRRGMTYESLNCLGKTPVRRDRLTMHVIVGRSLGRHCLRVDVGIGSRSENVLDRITEIRVSGSSVETGVKAVRLVESEVKYW